MGGIQNGSHMPWLSLAEVGIVLEYCPSGKTIGPAAPGRSVTHRTLTLERDDWMVCTSEDLAGDRTKNYLMFHMAAIMHRCKEDTCRDGDIDTESLPRIIFSIATNAWGSTNDEEALGGRLRVLLRRKR